MQYTMNCPDCGTALPQADGEQAFCQDCGSFVEPEIDEEALRANDDRFLDVGEPSLRDEPATEEELGYQW